MSENGDYTNSDWAGYDFTEARKQYDVHAGRSYATAQSQHKTAADLVPSSLETNSPTPVVIVCDVTGSMGDWPATIFSKLPYLDNECKEYLGPEAEISFAANADFNDSYPLQVRPFVKGREMEAQLKELVIGGGAGPDYAHEAYELTALYYARNVNMSKSQRKPIMIFIADEHFHLSIDAEQAKLAHVNLEKSLDTKVIFSELNKNYSVYLIRKAYGCGMDDEIVKRWAGVLELDRILELPSADRVVDLIFGILAKETDKVAYFKQEIESRQRPEQVATVYKSLETIHFLTEKVDETKSVMHTALKGKLTKRLLP